MTVAPTTADLVTRFRSILKRADRPELEPRDLEQLDETEVRAELRRVLAQLGRPGSCRSCGAAGYWLRHRGADGARGRSALYHLDGLVHFATCPHARQWRKPAPRKPAPPKAEEPPGLFD